MHIQTPFSYRLIVILFLLAGLLGCGGEKASTSAISCGAGTSLNAATNACEANLAQGLVVGAAGDITADTTHPEIQAALENARANAQASTDFATGNQSAFDEGVASVDMTTDNQSAFDEGMASVTPLHCGEGTEVNEDGEACQPTAEYRAAAVEEGRAAGFVTGRAEGVASVTQLICAEGTEVNEDGDACQPTPEYRARAVEDGRAEGVASVTPLNCAEGTEVNEGGEACEPNLSVDVIVDDSDTIVPTIAFAEQVCAGASGRFNYDAGTCHRRYDCFRGGFCSTVAAEHGYGADRGNIYVGHTDENRGCTTGDDRSRWIDGFFNGRSRNMRESLLTGHFCNW